MLIGKSLIGLTDIKGNNFAIDFAKIASDDERGNEGWSEYWWNKLDETVPHLQGELYQAGSRNELACGCWYLFKRH